jgi:hypothetical protein
MFSCERVWHASFGNRSRIDSLAGELLDVAGSVRNEQLIENSLRP